MYKTLKEIREVMDYINDLELGIGLTEREWVEKLDDMEWNKNCSPDDVLTKEITGFGK